jgi:glycogen(starch) synthase
LTGVLDDGAPALPPIDVLVVSSWFPAYDDVASGRFVADQTEAIAATGAARPAVISFDGARLSGGARSRTRQAETVLDAAIAALRRASPLFVAPAWGVDPGLPVARLSVADGLTRSAGAEHAVVQRESVLRSLADRLATERTQAQAPGDAGAAPAATARGVVHAHTVYPDGAAAAVLAERLGWPLVITEHASFVDRIVATPVLRARYAGALARAQAVLAVSEMLAGELRATFPDHAGKIAVLPNAVPVELFQSASPEERVADQLLFVGYRKTTKGIENLLRAVAIAHARRPTITLRLLGRSPDETIEAGWHALAAELGIADVVTFEQSVDRAGIADAMGRASLFVHPSPRETFGVVAVEALASGLPVVATDSGGVSEILGPNPDDLGALVAVDDPEALADAIVRTLERRDSFDPVALRASVERRFGSAYVAERLLVVYRAALGPQLDGDASFTAGPVAAAEAAPPPGRTLIVALDRRRAALRLAPLPDALRAQLDVVTAVEPSDVELPPVRRLIEVPVETEPKPPVAVATPRRRGLAGRLARLASDPIGTIQRRLGRGAGSGPSLRPATDAIRRHVAGAGEQLDVLPMDGHDHLAVEPLMASGKVRLSTGGLRRLADIWHASRGSGLG